MLLHPFEDANVGKAERTAAFEDQADSLSPSHCGRSAFVVHYGSRLLR
jgi:hypothetical protein